MRQTQHFRTYIVCVIFSLEQCSLWRKTTNDANGSSDSKPALSICQCQISGYIGLCDLNLIVTQERHKPELCHAKIISIQSIYLKMSLGFIFWFVCYLEVQFEGSAVPPQLTVSQSGPARNVSETRKSGLETPSHCCPLRDWIGTTTNSNGDNQ